MVCLFGALAFAMFVGEPATSVRTQLQLNQASFGFASSSEVSEAVSQLEAQFDALRNQVRLGQTLTPQVREVVVELIELVTHTIEPAIRRAHERDQQLVNATYAAFTACSGEYNNATQDDNNSLAVLNATKQGITEAIPSVQQKYSTLNDSFRAVNTSFTNNRTKCCDQYKMCPGTLECDIQPFGKAYVDCDYIHSDAQACAEAFRGQVEHLEAYFVRQHDIYKNKKKDCEDASTDFLGKKETYDSEHLEYTLSVKRINVRVSNYNTKLGQIKALDDANCAAWARCHSNASSAHERVTDLIRPRGASRKREYIAALRISCMLTSFLNAGAFDDTTMSACSDNVSSSMHLDIIYRVLPPAPSINSSSDPLCFASGTEEMDNLTARAPPELPVYARCGAELDAPPQVFTPPECGISGNVVCVKRESDAR